MSMSHSIVEPAFPSASQLARFPSLRALDGLPRDGGSEGSDPRRTWPPSPTDSWFQRFDESALQEAMTAYRRIVADGRHVGLLSTDPRAAARKLGLELSDDVVTIFEEARIGTATAHDLSMKMTANMWIYIVGIAVGVVVIAGGLRPASTPTSPPSPPDGGGGDPPHPEPVESRIHTLGTMLSARVGRGVTSMRARPETRFGVLDRSGLRKL